MTRLANPSSAAPSKPGRRSAAPPPAWYAARDILDETDTHYLIRWEGDDPATHAPFEPSWEPKRNANAALVREWNRSGKRAGRNQDDNAPGDDARRDADAAEGDGREPRHSPVASFPVRAIVAERRNRYCVAWAPDPQTGEEYPDTWEPKHYVSGDLVDAYRRQKQERRQQQRLQRKQRREKKKKRQSRAASNEPKTPHVPSKEKGRQENELVPENEATPDIVVGRSALGNAAASRINGNRGPTVLRRARMAKIKAIFPDEENMSPFWDPACRSRSGKVIQYGAKKNWSLVLRS